MQAIANSWLEFAIHFLEPDKRNQVDRTEQAKKLKPFEIKLLVI